MLQFLSLTLLFTYSHGELRRIKCRSQDGCAWRAALHREIPLMANAEVVSSAQMQETGSLASDRYSNHIHSSSATLPFAALTLKMGREPSGIKGSREDNSADTQRPSHTT